MKFSIKSPETIGLNWSGVINGNNFGVGLFNHIFQADRTLALDGKDEQYVTASIRSIPVLLPSDPYGREPNSSDHVQDDHHSHQLARR